MNQTSQNVKPTAMKDNSAIAIIGVLFFIFGFISWINAILIPYFKLTCSLTDKQSMLVAFAFYISYFIMAFPASAILKKTGFKNGMMLGLWTIAIGALIFIPAALSRTYSLFLFGLFIQATGLTILQTASNPYIVILGPIESAAKRISIMGVCNKIAGAIAPLILIGFLTKSDTEIDEIKAQLPNMMLADKELLLNELAARLIIPYIIIAVVLVALGIMIRLSSLPDIKEPEDTEGGAARKTSVFQYPHLVLGALTVFCAVSVEVLAVNSIIGYGEHSGLAFKDAKYFATYTLLFMIVSYILATILIPKYIKQRQVLQIVSIAGFVLTLVAVSVSGISSVWAIALLGLANAVLWPAIWPLAIDGIGRFMKQGSALLIMGIIGGALMPLIYGAISDYSNPQVAYAVMLPCYIFIFYYATYGYKVGKQAV